MPARKKTALVPRKRPEQDRSRATVDAILEAAAHILIKWGYEAFTTNRVAEKAGVSIGSLYQYFPNKDALLSELMQRHLNDIEQTLDIAPQMIEATPLDTLIRTAIDQNVRSHMVEPELHRVLSEQVPQLRNLDWKQKYTARIEARVSALLVLKRNEIAVGDLDLAAYVITRTAEAVIHNAVSQRPQELRSGALAEELSRMLVGYLTGKPHASRKMAKAAAE